MEPMITQELGAEPGSEPKSPGGSGLGLAKHLNQPWSVDSSHTWKAGPPSVIPLCGSLSMHLTTFGANSWKGSFYMYTVSHRGLGRVHT